MQFEEVVDVCLKWGRAVRACSSDAAIYEQQIRHLQLTLDWPEERWRAAVREAEATLDRLMALEKQRSPEPRSAQQSPHGPSGYRKLGDLARAYGAGGMPDQFQPDPEVMKRLAKAFGAGIGSGIGGGRMKIPKPGDEKEGRWPQRKGESPFPKGKDEPEPQPAPAPPPPEQPQLPPPGDNLFFALLMEHIEPEKHRLAGLQAEVNRANEQMAKYVVSTPDYPDPDWAKNFVPVPKARLPAPGGVTRAKPGQIRATLMYPSAPGQIHLILPEVYAVLEWPTIAGAHPPVSWLTSDEWEVKGAWPTDKQITFVSGKPVKVGDHLEVTYVVKRNA